MYFFHRPSQDRPFDNSPEPSRTWIGETWEHRLKLAALVIPLLSFCGTVLYKIATWGPLVTQETLRTRDQALVSDFKERLETFEKRLDDLSSEAAKRDEANQAAHEQLRRDVGGVGGRVDQVLLLLGGATKAPTGVVCHRGICK